MRDSNELFELCKQLFEKTGWGSTDLDKQMYVETEFGPDYVESIGDGETFWEFPLYTSDYLLEKLPKHVDYLSLSQNNKLTIDSSDGEKGKWYAHYWLKSRRLQVSSNTPRKALLKLTLKLHEEGLI